MTKEIVQEIASESLYSRCDALSKLIDIDAHFPKYLLSKNPNFVLAQWLYICSISNDKEQLLIQTLNTLINQDGANDNVSITLNILISHYFYGRQPDKILDLYPLVKTNAAKIQCDSIVLNNYEMVVHALVYLDSKKKNYIISDALNLCRDDSVLRSSKHYLLLLQTIGLIYSELEQYDLALELLKNIKAAIYELPQADIFFESSIEMNLGKAYTDAGWPSKAVEHFERAYTLIRSTEDEYFGLHNDIIFNLGFIYGKLGDWDKAQHFTRLAAMNYIEMFGKDFIGSARRMQNLGALQLKLNNFDSAIAIFHHIQTVYDTKGEAMRRFEPELEHLLGSAYSRAGNNIEAKRICLSSLSKIKKSELGYIREKANLSLVLGECYEALGQVDSALICYFQAKRALDEISVRNDNAFISCSWKIARIYIGSDSNDHALKYLRELHGSVSEKFALGAKYFTREERINFINYYKPIIHDIILMSIEPENGYLQSLAFEFFILFNNINSRYQLEVKLIDSSENGDYNTILLGIDKIEKRLARIESASIADSLYFEHRQLVRSLGNFETSATGFIQQHKWSNIRLNIADSSTTLAFFQLTSPSAPKKNSIYCFVLNKTSNPTLLNLCLVDSIFSMRDLTNSQSDTNLIVSNTLTSKNFDQLDVHIWSKLQTMISTSDNIYIAATGALANLPLSAMAEVYFDSSKTFSRVVDIGYKHQQSRFKYDFTKENAVLVGGINYTGRTENIFEVDLKESFDPDPNYRSLVLMDSINWPTLEYTINEITEISQTLQNNKVKAATYSDHITKQLLRNVIKTTRPAILHIATHGFSAPIQQFSDNIKSTYNPVQAEILFHPLRRTGLVLSQPTSSIDDATLSNILTAQEIALTDLSNTQLVVLSACHTASNLLSRHSIDLGEQGIYGLASSLKLAGAKQLILSLWDVDDRASMEFMVLFYEELMETKSAALAMKNTRALMKQKYSDPADWAGWILIN